MIDFAPVQEALYDALTDPSPGPYPVYDAVPQESEDDLLPPPYLALGAVTQLPGEEIESPSSNATINVHAWSDAHGKHEAYDMLQYVRERLDYQEIGAGVWMCFEEFTTVMEDPSSTADRRLYHGVSRYRIRFNTEEI